MTRRSCGHTISGAFGELLLYPDTRGKSAPHFHATHAIGVNRSGGGTLFALGRSWSFTSGMVVVTNPFDPHWGRPSPEGLDYCLLYPRPEWARALPALRSAPASFWFDCAVLEDAALAGRLSHAFERLAEDGWEGPLAEAVGALFADYAKPAHADSIERWLETSPPGTGEIGTGENIAHLAAEAGVSRSHFSRTHRRRVGLSPLEHRRQARVLAARVMIEAGMSLVDAASEAGFADQAHMTRQFRQILGVTPAAYRQGN